MSETAGGYTEHRYTKPQEHTLYPQPSQMFECAECGVFGYWYPQQQEVWVYHKCIWDGRVHAGNKHVWVLEGTRETQGAGDYAFPKAVPARNPRYA